MLADYASRTYLWLELGLESGHDQTLAWLNRGHTVAAFDDAVRRAQQRHLRVCAHLILGLLASPQRLCSPPCGMSQPCV